MRRGRKVAGGRNLQPGALVRGVACLLLRSSIGVFSMQIDRASTEKVIAMLGLTLSFLLLLAIITLAFV